MLLVLYKWLLQYEGSLSTTFKGMWNDGTEVITESMKIVRLWGLHKFSHYNDSDDCNTIYLLWRMATLSENGWLMSPVLLHLLVCIMFTNELNIKMLGIQLYTQCLFVLLSQMMYGTNIEYLCIHNDIDQHHQFQVLPNMISQTADIFHIQCNIYLW